MAAKIEKGKCTGCALCIEVCPAEAIIIKENIAVVSDDCIDCGACVGECPNNAISV